jgi:hypothetical protein
VQEGEKGIHHIKVMTKVNIQAAGARQEKQTGRKARSRRGSLPKQHVCIEKKKKSQETDMKVSIKSQVLGESTFQHVKMRPQI